MTTKESRPEKPFPKMNTDQERLIHVEQFADYYQKFSAEKIANYILGTAYNDKSDLSRPYVSSLSQGVGDDADTTIENLYSSKLKEKTFRLVEKRDFEKTSPEYEQINEAIQVLKDHKEKATGREKFILSKALIETYQDRAALSSFLTPETRTSFSTPSGMRGNSTADRIAEIDLTNEKHIKETIKIFPELLAQIEGDTYTSLGEAAKALINEITSLVDDAVKNGYIRPGDGELIRLRMKGYTNVTIKPVLKKLHNMDFTTDYYSTLFSKICKRLAEWQNMRQKEKESQSNKYAFAICTRCGEKKLLTSTNWAKKHCSPTGYAARCKTCDKIVRQERKKAREEN